MTSATLPISCSANASSFDEGNATRSEGAAMLNEEAQHDTGIEAAMEGRLKCEADAQSAETTEHDKAAFRNEEEHANMIDQTGEDSAADETDAIHQVTARCKTYGHNSLNIGQYFRNRRDIRNAGGHSELVAGVCAGENGAYAIVISDAPYEGYNRDFGQVVHYAATGSNRVTETEEFLENMSTQALDKSNTDQHPHAEPVRVFRRTRKTGHMTMHNKWLLEPGRGPNLGNTSGGYRYDGLYECFLKCWTDTNTQKFYPIYYFERCRGQDDADWRLSVHNGEEPRDTLEQDGWDEGHKYGPRFGIRTGPSTLL